MDEVISMINQSRFLVADLTEHKNGVYFEAGYASGLGLPVIYTCEKACLGNAHFDVKHLNIIDWTTPENLTERLEHTIKATMRVGAEPAGGTVL